MIQVDDSSEINVHIQSKSQLESIYFIRTKNVKLYLENQTLEKETGLTLQYEISTLDEEFQTQRVAHWSKATADAAFITETVVRDGIYPTTAQMKKAAEDREELALVRMADMLAQGIRITKPTGGGKAGVKPIEEQKPGDDIASSFSISDNH